MNDNIETDLNFLRARFVSEESFKDSNEENTLTIKASELEAALRPLIAEKYAMICISKITPETQAICPKYVKLELPVILHGLLPIVDISLAKS